MNEVQTKVWNKLCSLSGEQAATIFVNYFGLQILSNDFAKHVAEELECDYSEVGLEDD